MGAIVLRTRYDEGTESSEVATSGTMNLHVQDGGPGWLNELGS
jgi:nitrogen-specific signal transduction histidine kinase